MARKTTTQDALLENLLRKLRTKRIVPFTQGKRVLDFGCGREALTLQFIRPYAAALAGFDTCFEGEDSQTVAGIQVFGSVSALSAMPKFDLVTSLACFEHLTSDELTQALQDLYAVTTEASLIVGTVPTPPAKPVLEFLSYRLRWIDRSQIEDHKVYYDRETLEQAVKRGGWKLRSYQRFQLGMNSFFVLGKLGREGFQGR